MCRDLCSAPWDPHSSLGCHSTLVENRSFIFSTCPFAALKTCAVIEAEMSSLWSEMSNCPAPWLGIPTCQKGVILVTASVFSAAQQYLCFSPSLVLPVREQLCSHRSFISWNRPTCTSAVSESIDQASYGDCTGAKEAICSLDRLQ